MASGWQALGNAIGGGNKLPSELAYEQGQSLGANTQDALAQARARIDKNNFMENLDQDPRVQAAFPDPKERATYIASTLAGQSPDNVVNAQIGANKLRTQQQIADPNTSPDLTARLAISQGMPANFTHAVGEAGSFTNELTPGVVNVAPLGAAIAGSTVAKNNAAAASSNSEVPLHAAQTAVQNALAANGGRLPSGDRAPLLDSNGQPVMDPNTGLPVLTARQGGASDINAPRPMGAREAQQANRALILGQQATRDLQQVTSIPVGTNPGGLLGMVGSAMPSLGIAGYGGGPQRSLLESVKADLTNRAAPEAVQQYTTLSSGMARMLMGLENPTSQGNSGGASVLDQFNKLNVLDGDSNEQMMLKLAKQKQIIESSLQEQILNSNRTPQAYKDSAQGILDHLNAAIPFEPEDVIRLHNSSGAQTLGSILGISPANSKFRSPATPGASAPGAAATAPANSTPAAAAPASAPAQSAPPAALQFLAAHPEAAGDFKAKYGYLPGAQ